MILQKHFNGVEVDFEPFIKNKNVMVNATQMAKIFGKLVGHFLENESTEKFISACLNNRNSDYLMVKKREDLIDSKQKNGTWMHRILALKFAAWLDPDFEVWVYRTIEEILFGELTETENSIERTVALQQEKRKLAIKQGKTGEDFERYLAVCDELKEERNRRRSITKNRFEDVYDLFNQPGMLSDN